jgi:hypothetical protein
MSPTPPSRSAGPPSWRAPTRAVGCRLECPSRRRCARRWPGRSSRSRPPGSKPSACSTAWAVSILVVSGASDSRSAASKPASSRTVILRGPLNSNSVRVRQMPRAGEAAFGCWPGSPSGHFPARAAAGEDQKGREPDSGRAPRGHSEAGWTNGGRLFDGHAGRFGVDRIAHVELARLESP